MPKEIRIIVSDEEHQTLREKKEKLGLETWRDALRRGLQPECEMPVSAVPA